MQPESVRTSIHYLTTPGWHANTQSVLIAYLIGIVLGESLPSIGGTDDTGEIILRNVSLCSRSDSEIIAESSMTPPASSVHPANK